MDASWGPVRKGGISANAKRNERPKMRIIAIKIDCTKITKERLYPGKKGGKYLSALAMELDEPDRYGNDWRIVEAVSKEERQAGKRGPILGNGKNIGGAKRQEQKPAQAQAGEQPQEDDVPF